MHTHEHVQTKQIQGWGSSSVGKHTGYEMSQVQFLAWPELYRKNTIQEGIFSGLPAPSNKVFLFLGDLLLSTL